MNSITGLNHGGGGTAVTELPVSAMALFESRRRDIGSMPMRRPPLDDAQVDGPAAMLRESMSPSRAKSSAASR